MELVYLPIHPLLLSSCLNYDTSLFHKDTRDLAELRHIPIQAAADFAGDTG